MQNLLRNQLVLSVQMGKLIFCKSFVLIPLLLMLITCIKAQNLPLGYIEYYNHACNKTDLFSTLAVDDSASWLIVAEKPANSLRIRSTDSVENVFPRSRAMLSQWIWGDFILRFDFRHVLSDSSKTLGFTFLGAARNADTYYAYSFTPDSLKLFYISDSTVEQIRSHTLESLNNKWNTVIVKRDILNRSFSFSINNSPELISFSHPDLVMGYVGFGNNAGTAYLKNIRLWAPTVIDEKLFRW